MTRGKLSVVLMVGALGLGCTETPVSVALRSLERSGDVSFVCVTDSGEGRDIDSCPDFDQEDDEQRNLLALVTQTVRGEVAVVNLSAGSVVDVDPSTPGYGFLPIGAVPQDIVSTPGGVGSFVGVGEPSKEGIYALPASCLGAPDEGERARDLTSWPACALPTVPGSMAILLDPPDAGGLLRSSCDAQRAEAEPPPAATREVCPADLSLETSRPGRRKLVVALPSRGEIAIIDAQALLDREPGSFDPCPVERLVRLSVDLPTAEIEQPVPEDLQAPDCVADTVRYAPPAEEFQARPAGFALSGDVLYVGDQGAPVIHRLSVSDPCSPVELPPLLPLSYEEPSRVVTTKRLAVSPLSTQGQRFAYAIDDYLGDVMIFDVSPTSSERTPLLRSGSPRLPPAFEPPDRIRFNSPAKDVQFVLRDEPEPDPTTGVALIGRRCDPDPYALPDAPGVSYRTSSDYRQGAGPRELRGVFGFIMLANGEIAVIDVEDFDAPCRRPVQSNPASVEDFHGCANDSLAEGLFYTEGGDEGSPRTVSGEASCRIFDAHRPRSATLMVSSSGIGVSSPSLRAAPSLRSEQGGNLATDASEKGQDHPKLLAVPFPDPRDPSQSVPAEAYVGTTLYRSGEDVQERLYVDSATAEENSLALLLNQPRAFPPQQDISASYEGAVVGELPAGLLRLTGAEEADYLEDGAGRFCDRGVQDSVLTRVVGEELGVAEADLDAFVRLHSDYVQITSDFPEEDDSYWSTQSSVGYLCGDQAGGSGYQSCEALFGTPDEPNPRRDLRIVEAYQSRLTVEPREPDRDDIIDLLYCCFGAGQVISYRVRAGHQWVVRGSETGFEHNLIAGPFDEEVRDHPCIRDCAPRRARLRGRAFEIATEEQVRHPDPEIREPTRYACVFPSDPEAPEEPDQRLPEPVAHDSPCVFQNLTMRFAVYRGREESERDMAFGWRISGGFVPLSASLLTIGGTTAVSPQSLTYVPQVASLAVVDGAQKGLTFVALDSVRVSYMFY